MEDECIDLIVTDPPYKTTRGGDTNPEKYNRPKGVIGGDRKIFKHQKLAISDWMPEIYRVLKDNSHCYTFTNALNLVEMANEAIKAGFKLQNILVWEKNNCTPSQFYMRNCEYILFLRKGKAKWINNLGTSKTAHHYNNIIGNKLHPTQKPVDLLKLYISNSSNEGDIVLDPFAGSGSTLVACQELNRKYVGYEIDKQYYDISVSRMAV